jgi:hypothetical protein
LELLLWWGKEFWSFKDFWECCGNFYGLLGVLSRETEVSGSWNIVSAGEEEGGFEDYIHICIIIHK